MAAQSGHGSGSPSASRLAGIARGQAARRRFSLSPRVRGVSMKLWIWSDLHLEMQDIPLPERAPDGVDVIVCAGDLCYAPHLGRRAFDIVHRYDLPLVFVPGNHEFY